MHQWADIAEFTQAFYVLGEADYEPPIDMDILNAIGNISLYSAVAVGVIGAIALRCQKSRRKN